MTSEELEQHNRDVIGKLLLRDQRAREAAAAEDRKPLPAAVSNTKPVVDLFKFVREGLGG